jgi:hypothetical protein
VRQIFEVVARGREAAVDLIQSRLGGGQPVYGYEVDDACRAVIESAGYGPNFFHRTGHSLGWLDHFLGVNIDILETQDRRGLLPGVLFTIEPGIYLPEFNFDESPAPKGLGIRSEINPAPSTPTGWRSPHPAPDRGAGAAGVSQSLFRHSTSRANSDRILSVQTLLRPPNG